MKYRIHLRTSAGTARFGINPLVTGWGSGFNIRFGYWFLAIRRKHKGEVKRPLVDLKFGRAMRRESRMRRSEAYKVGRQEGAASVFEAWISEEGHYYLIEDLLKHYDLVYEYDRVRTRRPDVNTDGVDGNS